MAAQSGSTSSVPSLPPPCPKSPPEYPDLYGKRRETAKVQLMEREIGFLEEELKSIEGLHPASKYCKEVADFVLATSDPLIPMNRKNRRSCRFWKWLWYHLLFMLSLFLECPVLSALGFHGFAVAAVILGVLFVCNCHDAANVIIYAVTVTVIYAAALIYVDVIYATVIHAPAVLYQSACVVVVVVALARHQIAVKKYHAAKIVVAFAGFLRAQIALALVSSGNALVLNVRRFHSNVLN
ncbi:hypothetical protein Ddye_020402 [Dipteronia dyeriana]|uniref:G protein gamma domain-containing protein n=1 Tax=Dipteronia dyeriana TaxID=168575 RepID=A0AAD9U061_9ROSI|nr:hypothetical protein Ddye_020402 [Dipteronia dyeriana]